MRVKRGNEGGEGGPPDDIGNRVTKVEGNNGKREKYKEK